MKIYFPLFVIIFLTFSTFAQKGSTTVGIQIKPIFPVSYLGTGKQIHDTAGVHFETSLTSGFNFGVIIRHNFTDLFAFETGINYVKRTYSQSITEGDFEDNSKFRIISYEIPFVLLAYSRIAEKIYINGSLGPILDMFASHIETSDPNFRHVAFRNQVFLPAISANLGVEYRTEKSGNIYIGASFQRPFDYIYLSRTGLYRDRQLNPLIVENELLGSYFTVDLRYFFPENNRKGRVNEE